MTTKEIKEKQEQFTKELNKLKAYTTSLAKALVKQNIEVSLPNWKEEVKPETTNEKL